MTQPIPIEGPSPEQLRRLNEFQAKVRQPSRPAQVGVPARGPLSQHQADILARLRRRAPTLADSMEQALRDVNDHTRLTYMGPAGEVREVMRAAIQIFAPDEEVKAQPWFKGHEQGGKVNPTQAERIRYAVQKRGGSTDQVKGTDEVIDKLVGQIGRETYSVGSKAFHAGVVRRDVEKLAGWVFTVLGEILPD
jgi:hypothetical protein